MKQPKHFIFFQATAVLWFVQQLNRQKSYRSIIGPENQLVLVFSSFGTLRRSLPEQYSMVSRGESFKENDFNSSGTSLAWTTFIWFSLRFKKKKRQSNRPEAWVGCAVKTSIIDFFCRKLTDFFMIWISLIQRLLLAEFNSRRQSFTAILSSDSCKNTEDNGTNLGRKEYFPHGQKDLQGVGRERHSQILPSPVSSSFPKSRRDGPLWLRSAPSP